jgi:superfamily II DNA or RNA helicase
VPIPRTKWKNYVERSTVRTLEALIDSGGANAFEDSIFVPSLVAVDLPAEVCDRLGVPSLAKLGLAVGLEGRVETPEGHLRLRWTDAGGMLIQSQRVGPIVEWGLKKGRLSSSVFRVVEAAEGYNRTRGEPFEQRVTAWMPVQQALHDATGADVSRDGFLETFVLYQAGSFGLDVHENDNFTPILMSRSHAPSLEDDAPTNEFDAESNKSAETPGAGIPENLLPPDDHREFLNTFAASAAARDAYRVGHNRYVLIDRSLKRALDLTKTKQRGGAEERKNFLRNPRAAIARALEEAGEDTPSASLFIETKSYSDRVAGLGLWERPKIPWLKPKPNAWLPEAGWVHDGEHVEPPSMTEEQIAEIEQAYELAEARGDPTVIIAGTPIPIDSVPKVIAELRARANADSQEDSPGAGSGGGDSAERLVLILGKTNFDGVDYELALKPRPAQITTELPAHLLGQDPMKPHQREGFQWLTEAWQAGWPGVLLADDMGLGKTYQALAFMAWLRQNAVCARERGIVSVAQGPMLIVAPTALLKNWEKECADRLAPGALGKSVAAYGRSLHQFKLDPARRSDAGETLDRGRLREADWILTTYETLTDHERSFAPIFYSLVVFDEMQKVKAPDTLNTKAAKVLNADFVVGLTGTPIENRMEDLWCLFDRLAPGYLGDLRGFSATYKEENQSKLTELKRRLDHPVETAPRRITPAIMKRRMKADILVGLPEKNEQCYPATMPPEQAEAYRALVVEAKRQRERSPGFMLKVLHGLRGISLHPRDATVADVSSAVRFEEFAGHSARLAKTVEILRGIRARGEKALVFIEYLGMQDAVAEGLAALFDLPRRPSVISGSTPGERRLSIVEAFQSAGDGFGLLILSPRAAGVGLNITAANHVVHLSRWWNPAVEDQCNDRAHRIGQTKKVTVHIPVAIHPDLPGASFDERLHAMLERKRALSRHMLAPPTSESDVGELFGGTIPD